MSVPLYPASFSSKRHHTQPGHTAVGPLAVLQHLFHEQAAVIVIGWQNILGHFGIFQGDYLHRLALDFLIVIQQMVADRVVDNPMNSVQMVFK